MSADKEKKVKNMKSRRRKSGKEGGESEGPVKQNNVKKDMERIKEEQRGEYRTEKSG